MEDIINIASQPQTSYYQSNQSQFYSMARLRHRQDVLNKMQQTFDTYSKGSEYKEESRHEKISEINKNNEPKHEPSKQDNQYNNNLNLGNIADILSGNGDISKTLIKLLSGKNKDFANLMRLIDNPMIKNMFSKKQSKPASAENLNIDNSFFNDDIDKLEKIADN